MTLPNKILYPFFYLSHVSYKPRQLDYLFLCVLLVFQLLHNFCTLYTDTFYAPKTVRIHTNLH
jgi:hypothetical protein